MLVENSSPIGKSGANFVSEFIGTFFLVAGSALARSRLLQLGGTVTSALIFRLFNFGSMSVFKGVLVLYSV